METGTRRVAERRVPARWERRWGRAAGEARWGLQEPCTDVHLTKSVPAQETGGQLRAGAGQESRTTQPGQPRAGRTAEVLGSQGAGGELCFGPVEWTGPLWASPGCSGGEISGSSKSWPLDITPRCAQTESVTSLGRGGSRDPSAYSWVGGPQLLCLGMGTYGHMSPGPPPPRATSCRPCSLSLGKERWAGRGGVWRAEVLS